MEAPLQRSASSSCAVGLLGSGWQQGAEGRDTSEDDGERRLERTLGHGVGDGVVVIVEIDVDDFLETQSTDYAGEEAAHEGGDDGQFL